MKKTVWRPIILGIFFGLLAGLTTAAGLSFLTPGVSDNAIGFYATLLLLSASLGGPLAGVIAPMLFVAISALFGPPEMKEMLTIPGIFWPNLIALGTTMALVGFAYRLLFERLTLAIRLLAWAGVVLAYYVIIIPFSITPQYYLLGESTSEILPAIVDAYRTYFPQAIFDIVFTSLVLVALPTRYRRPLWIDRQAAGPVSEHRGATQEIRH